jgi:hypothetical protein
MPRRRMVSIDPPNPESTSAAPPLRRLRQIAALARTVSGQRDLDAVLAHLRMAMQSLRPDARCPSASSMTPPAAIGWRVAPETWRGARR